ncbi:F-box protein At5g07610-like [Aegilops tauschii subsp. strangulata]|uniref:F-box protein At5g07610-like n=1 Tax=Aegilops tauschii subsp. strangulata TaxID=200361 RepID=UPI00098AE022|nr:F-box protein At5g07610-like [Aegilops tauschii subsp. strangulata]
MAANPVHHRRTKHIELDIHFVREKVALGQLRVLHVPTTQQFADVMTKGLPTATFQEFRSSFPPHGGMAAERLTDDLLVEILSRVPVRSVCRFKCVSKHWLSLIEHPGHRRKLPQTLAGFFYTVRINNRQLPLETKVRFVNVSGKSCPLVGTSFTFLPSHQRIYLLDCCNGLLLCRWYGISAPVDEFCYILCNPATEEWVSLPDHSHVSKVAIVSLGFDPAISSHFYVFVLLKDVYFNFYLSVGGVDVYSS